MSPEPPAFPLQPMGSMYGMDALIALRNAKWVDASGRRYFVGDVQLVEPHRFALHTGQHFAAGQRREVFGFFSEAEWAARGIRTVEAWERQRAAEAKEKAEKAEAARIQAEAQAEAFKAALADLTELVMALRQELAQVRDELRAESMAVRDDTAALRRRA